MKRFFIIVLLALVALPAFAQQDTLTVTTVAVSGTTPTLASFSGDTLMIANDGTVWLELANSNGSSRTATIVSQVADYMPLPAGVAASNQAVTIPATTGNKLINITEITSWKDKSSPYTMVILSDTTGVTGAAFKLANK